MCWWDAALPFKANWVPGNPGFIFLPFPPQELQYFLSPWFPFKVITDFDIDDGEAGLELLGEDVVDFLRPWEEEAGGEEFLEDRPTLFTDPAGEDVLLGIRLSVLFAEFLAELVFCVLVYVSSVKNGLGVKLLKKI